MAHCTYEDIVDLESCLEVIRSLDKVIERKPGTFYMKGKGFLHFHKKDGERWADVRDGLDWGEKIDIPFSAKKGERASFIKEVKKRHERTINK